MKSAFIALLLSLSFSVSSQINSPREAFTTYLKSMVEIKNGADDSVTLYKRAIKTFDLSHIENNLKYELGKRYANELIRVLDKIKKVDYSKIPESLDEPIWYFDKRMYKSHFLEISLIKKDSQWLFSKKTLDSLDLYHVVLQNEAGVTGVITLTTYADQIKSALPSFMLKRYFILESWQWLCVLVIMLLAFMIEQLTDFIAARVLKKNITFINDDSKVYLEKMVRPLGKIIFILCFSFGINYIELLPPHLAFVKRGVSITLSVFAVWLGQNIVRLISDFFKERASRTVSKFDDIMIPLLTKTSFVLIYVFGIILVANSLTIDVTNIVAGLGIGGLAFAFAAKDTLANFFGSIMLVLDRPFDIGDVIQSGDIEGTVFEVGFRSTRIRTFYDSIITISNGELMNRSIDNKGKRRYRRLNTTLGLEYSTPPQKVEAFCEGIRQLILNHRWTRKDNFHVYFTSFGASSLDIQLMVFWETDDYSREQSEKHRLMIDILRLSKELKVGFAFPTQTLHVFNEEKVVSEEFETQKYLDEGISKAQELLFKPLSLKNPRSNAKDEKQFGSNDIGLD